MPRCRIGCVVFGGGETTLGMEVVCAAIRDQVPEAELVGAVGHVEAKDCDILLVSLYWWEDCYALIRWLADAGIDPRQRKPQIVIGGMMVVNPWVLDGYYHWAVIGDGEEVAPQLVRAIMQREMDFEAPGVMRAGAKTATFAPPAALKGRQYMDLRTNKVTRIEIARGCRLKCPFCLLAAIKPYRELPYDVICHLVRASETKNIALFAPDKGSHSKIADIESAVKRAGKKNTGTDYRLDTLKAMEFLPSVGIPRMGIEAFTERGRRKIKGIKSDDDLLEGMDRVFNVLKSESGKPLSKFQIYMIGDLPMEREEAALVEFNSIMGRMDALLDRPFNLFVSISGFTPHPLTRMGTEALDPYTSFNEWFDRNVGKNKNMKIAKRGGVMQPAKRMAHMLVIRGDERARKLVYWLAATPEGRKLTAMKGRVGGNAMEGMLMKVGYSLEDICGEVSAESLPSARVSMS